LLSGDVLDGVTVVISADAHGLVIDGVSQAPVH